MPAADASHPLHQRGDYSEETARQIDAEVSRIIAEQHERARRILAGQLPVLRAAAQLLMSQETLTGDELRAMIERERQVAA